MSRIKLNISKFMTRIHTTHQPLALDLNASDGLLTKLMIIIPTLMLFSPNHRITFFSPKYLMLNPIPLVFQIYLNTCSIMVKMK